MPQSASLWMIVIVAGAPRAKPPVPERAATVWSAARVNPALSYSESRAEGAKMPGAASVVRPALFTKRPAKPPAAAAAKVAMSSAPCLLNTAAASPETRGRAAEKYGMTEPAAPVCG